MHSYKSLHVIKQPINYREVEPPTEKKITYKLLHVSCFSRAEAQKIGELTDQGLFLLSSYQLIAGSSSGFIRAVVN